MSKKIHELARELNVTSKRLMEKLDEVDIHPKSHMSTLEDVELTKLYKHIGVLKKTDADDASGLNDAESKADAAERLKRKAAPRIIRKTEVVIRDADDYSKPQHDPKKADRKDFVRSSSSNDGLMAGYIRGNRPEVQAVKKHTKANDVEAVATNKMSEAAERAETIRLVERPAKSVDNILGVKKISREERVEREAEREARDAERDARDHGEGGVGQETAHSGHSHKKHDAAHQENAVVSEHHDVQKNDGSQGDTAQHEAPVEAVKAVRPVHDKKAHDVAQDIKTEEEGTTSTEQATPATQKKEAKHLESNIGAVSKDTTAGEASVQNAETIMKPAAEKASKPESAVTVSGSKAPAAAAERPENSAKLRHTPGNVRQEQPIPVGRTVQRSIRETMDGAPPRREGQGGAVIRPAGAARPAPARDGQRPVNDRQGGAAGERPYNNDRPYPPRDSRPTGDRPAGDRPYPPREGVRPAGDRPYPPREGVRPAGDRPYPPREGVRPAGDRPYPPREGVRPAGDRPYPPREGVRPAGDRPFNSRPSGDRPYTPRDGGNGPRPYNNSGPGAGSGARPYGNRPSYGGGSPRDPEGFDKDRVTSSGGRPMGRNAAGPKTDKPPMLEGKDSVRSERRSMSAVDRQREQKKGSRMDTARPTVVTNAPAGKFKPTIDIVGQKGSVKDMYSDEFVINQFYNDTQEVMNAKRAEKRIRRNRMNQNKHIPPKAVLTEITIGDTITVKSLAEALKKTAADVIKKLFVLGSAATTNQELDFETAEIIANEYGIKTIRLNVISAEEILFDDSEDKAESLTQRAPVVVVMGHVDHGKTSLLDAIRSENIADSEAGGITQHIGAYTVDLHGRDITFLDTPGHEAFTAMRARGAQVTDIAIIVVAADDGVMPQTIEAIHHAKAAGVAIIIAINKIDKPNANQERVKQELTQHGIVIEEWGGDIISVPVSAKQHQNIDQLLEMILLTADLMELKADTTRQAKGTVVEARLDKNKGPIATLLVQRGTLNVGDAILSGSTFGHIRAMTNDKGRRIKDAGPSVAVEITGLSEVPEAGELFYVVQDERVAKELAEKRRRETHEKAINSRNRITLDDLYSQIQSGKVEELNLIIKADVQGSVEAIKATLLKLSNDKVKVRIVHDAVGAITESDILLADVSNAIIIGFNIRPSQNVTAMAEAAGVDMRLYRIIYEAISDVEKAMKGLLAPTYKEVIDGHIEIRQLYIVSNVGTIGGSYVIDGKVGRNSEIRVVREGIVVHDGKLASLKRFKDDVREVVAGFECGVMVEKFNDIKVGDIVEAFHQEQVEA